MKILYGVQGTGQGHISRARAMAAALADYPVQVDWLFSGRDKRDLFDMEPFAEFLHRHGLTFATQGGRIRYRRTVMNSRPLQFLSDIRDLDLSHYDLVVTDFESVTAWAARLQGVPSVGIGHQYAFGGNAPVTGDSMMSRGLMRHFAPVQRGLGLHWFPYDPGILPPILDLTEQGNDSGDFFQVYLPFEDQQEVTCWLNQFGNYRFHQYSAQVEDGAVGNVLLRKANIKGFKKDLAACRGVICNSGFELLSECLQLGKAALTKPLAGQMEQLSNALALEKLGYAQTMPGLDSALLDQWLR